MATEADITRIETALARGELTVRAADGSMVTYRSVAELERALSILQSRQGTVAFDRSTFASFARD